VTKMATCIGRDWPSRKVTGSRLNTCSPYRQCSRLWSSNDSNETSLRELTGGSRRFVALRNCLVDWSQAVSSYFALSVGGMGVISTGVGSGEVAFGVTRTGAP